VSSLLHFFKILRVFWNTQSKRAVIMD